MATLSVKILTAILLIVVCFEWADGKFANCPSGCSCDDKTLVVKCGEGQLDVLPIALNPSIQRLIIKNNKIKSIYSSLQFYAQLVYLDLSINHLLTIPSKTFNHQKKLEELHLNHNKISAIGNETFDGLTSLTVLNLRGNFLDTIGRSVFRTMPKMEELNLGQNRISRIDIGAFDGLPNLRVLILDDNQLSTVPSIAMAPLTNLAELFLGINSFRTIPAGSFEMLKHLTNLDLKGAGLMNVSLDAFRGLENSLRQLELSDNRLQRIPTVHLSELLRLEDLSLGQNDFDIVPEGAFVGLKNLRSLDISGSMHLQKIEAGAFSTNTNLESITIVSNKMLTEVQEGALSGLPHLKHVILRDNALTTLDEGLFPWNELHTFDLSENPIHCDCRVLWLRNLLILKNASQFGTDQEEHTIFCHAPERLRAQPLIAISPTLLGCAHSTSRHQAMIGALVVGSAATITSLCLLIYRFRRQIREVLKGRCTDSNPLAHKEREYQKTYYDEDSFLSRHTYAQATNQHPCNLASHPTTLNHYSYYTPIHRPSLPVSEL